jgi:hypothetical protein
MILDLIRQSLGQGEMDQIGRQLGARPEQTQQAIAAALPLLLGALGRNSSQPQGAASLADAVARDHDGSILDDLSGFLGQGNTSPGNAILKHVLGSRRQTVERGLGQVSGLQGQSASTLLSLLAPIVMGALGKARSSASLDSGGLSRLVQKEASSSAPSGQLGSLLSLLDSDHDGQVSDDIARIGSQLLGGFFGKK